MVHTLSDYHLERLGSHNGIFASIPLSIGANTVGRLPTNNIVLNSKYISRSHCTIYVTETSQVTIKNVTTTNGVFVNGVQKIQQNVDVVLNIDDVFGIGCDTTTDEISDEGCFIFKVKRNKIEDEVADEVILLDDSDEEEECRVQAEYSQLNQSLMKQELMELEDYFEEYNSLMIKKEPGEVVPTEPPAQAQESSAITSDIFEEIIANADKSYAEKSKLIENVPDVNFMLMKSIAIDEDAIVPTSHSNRNTEPENDSKKIKNERIERKSRRRRTKGEESTNASKQKEKEERKKTAIIKAHEIKKIQIPEYSNEVVTTTHPLVKECRVEILLKKVATQKKSEHGKGIEKGGKASANDSKCFLRSNILKRRNTFVPASTLCNRNTKKPVEIIDAPHLLTRRKSICVTPETFKPVTRTKEAEGKWLSKNVSFKPARRSKVDKEEIKLKLAALVPDPKDKVVEAKIVRTNTKIPVKNTHMSRNDQLAETIVTTSTPKHKIPDSAVLPEILKKRRLSTVTYKTEEPKFAAVKPNAERRQSGESKCATTKPNAESECVHNGSSKVSNDHPIANNSKRNATTSLQTTSLVVKSILKKSSPIQKRRVTVRFDEVPRIKTIPSITETVATIDRMDEENSDDVIHNIMALGISSLQRPSGATINGKNFAYKTVANEYETLKQLQNVFIPLMKAELWKEIEDGYGRAQSTPAANVQMNYCVRDDMHPMRYKYHCESQSSAAIQNGALIMLTSVATDKEFLGYIVNRQMTHKICYFQFVSPCSIQEAGRTAVPLKLKQLMYIRPNLKVFEALFKLKNSPLLKHILHPKDSCTKPRKHPFKYKEYNSLNQDQMITLSTVYRHLLTGQPFISLIEGPPGTGKSRLITSLVLQLLYGKEITQPLKILVCAPSNAAVDILTRNLTEARKNYSVEKGQKKMKLVRFGVLEKMDRSVRGVSLQELTKENSEKTVLIEQKKLMECKKKKEAELLYYTAKNSRDIIAALRNEISVIEAKMANVTYDEKCLLEGANVICTTLNSCCALSSKISSMDVCIIDEATQCNEPTSLIPLQFGVKSLILVGDTKQLPSTVVSEIAKQYNYDQSLFQRLQKSFESANEFENPILQLTTQYRMHPDILHWPNEYFYKNCLQSGETTKVVAFPLRPYTVFNLNFVQSAHTGQKHISNVDEAKFVRNLLDFLITKADPKLFSYGIISAYSQQKDDLSKDLSLTHPYVTVNTIDSCQGQERDVVIISIARTRGIGFLAIRQRLNVALTRAKKMLILCGNFSSLQSHPMWISLLDDARQRKVYVHLPTMSDNSLSSYFEQCLVT